MDYSCLSKQKRNPDSQNLLDGLSKVNGFVNLNWFVNFLFAKILINLFNSHFHTIFLKDKKKIKSE